MKTSSQILLLLGLFGLLSLSLSAEVSVTKSFSKSKYYSSKGNCDGSDNEETPPTNPGADAFVACDADNRPGACTFEYVPVCGYIHECEGGACTSTFGNKCAACATENVDGYVKGACEDVQTTCDPDNRPEVCTEIYTATCAVAANCEGSHCFQDTSSSCVACSMEGVAYSLPGICPENDDDDSDREYCDASNRPEVCTADWTPVCAHKNNCVGDSCWSTAGNACTACAGENIDFYVPGECSDDEDRTYCDADNRPEICTLDYTPVCAHIADCTGDDCWFTAGNACGACGNATVDYHIPGECSDDEEDNDDRTFCDADNRPDICTADYTPVCAHIDNCTGENCWFTAGNACGACGNETVDYHIPGECGPGDDRTYCDPNDRPEVCTLEYNPVCAHTSGCLGDDCWNTAGNACGACSDTLVDYHVPGECPDDGSNNEEGNGESGEGDDGEDGGENDNGRTECDVNNRPEICTLEYAPVCAHVIGCEGEGNDCFRTEGNGCGACSLDDIDYYTQGEC